jgi:hypothetical protein
MGLDASIARSTAVAGISAAAPGPAPLQRPGHGSRRVCRRGPLEPTRIPARPLVYLWALPTTAVGLLAFVLASIRGRVEYQVVSGVLEIHGGLITWLLTHATLLKGGASAMTLGHVVLGRDACLLEFTRDHERVHVRQCERWGPLFIPAYLAASLLVALRRGRPYEDNPFEREAFGRS